MRILLTGAFGNIGAHTLPQLLADGHTVRCFDVVSATNRRLTARWWDQVEVVWGEQPVGPVGCLLARARTWSFTWPSSCRACR